MRRHRHPAGTVPAVRRMRAAGRRAGYRVGRRGATLLLVALLDVIYAAGLALPPAETRATSGYRYVVALLPAGWWAGAWLAVGIVCLINAVRVSDRVAFAAAAALKFGWGLLYLAGWIAGVVARGYTSAAIWLAVAAWLLIVSTWPESHEPHPVKRGARR